MSTFLKDRHRQMFHEKIGDMVVTYRVFTSGAADSFTGDVTEASAYTGDPVELRASLKFKPSHALRALVGQDVDYDALLIVCTRDLEDEELTVKVGDVFDMPTTGDRYYVSAPPAPNKQLESEFLEQVIPIKHGSIVVAKQIVARKRASLYGDWRKAELTLKTLNKRMEANMLKATRVNAVQLRDAIKKKIRTGDPSWPANAPLTSKVKGSTKPLIDTGDLMNSVCAIQTPMALIHFFIGVPRTAGEKRVNIAALQEYGHPGIHPKRARALAIPANKQAVQAYLAARSVSAIPGLFKPKGKMVLMRKGERGPEVMFILVPKVVIPPRSFVGTTFKEQELPMRRRYRQAAAAAIRGKAYYVGR